MKRLSLFIALVVGLTIGTGCGAGIPSKFVRPKPPESFVAPQPEIWTLPNGLQVRYIEDRELPIVRGTLYVQGGQMWETADDLGLTDALGTLWRDGGTQSLSPDTLDKRLEELAANVSTSFGGEYGAASFDCLEPDLEVVSEIFKEVVLKPRFDEGRLSLWKVQQIDRIRRRADDPEGVAGIASAQLLFKGYRPGLVTTSTDVKRITVSMLKSQYEKLVRPTGATFAITGAIGIEKAKELAEKLFGSWEAKDTAALPELTPISDEPVKGVYFIKGPYTQASIVIAQRGVRRMSPDYASIEVFNEIFGSSGFSSRLFKSVRTQHGLAYSVAGGIFAGRRSGQNLIMIQTKGQSAGVAIAEALNVLRGIRSSGVTETEVSDSKRAIVNGFIFKVDSKGDVLNRGITQKYAGYPDNFDEMYLKDVVQVNRDDVRKVAEQRWNLDNLLVVVAGDESAYNSITEAIKGIPELNVPVQMIDFDEAAKLK